MIVATSLSSPLSGLANLRRVLSFFSNIFFLGFLFNFGYTTEHMTRSVNEILEQAREEKAEREGRQEREEVGKRFLEVFPDGFRTLPKGFQFRSRDPRGFSVSTFASPSKNVLFVQVEGEERAPRGGIRKVYNKYQVDRMGTIRATDRPQMDHLNEIALLGEILDRANEIALLEWRATSLDLNPQGEAEDIPVESISPGERPKGIDDLDMERIEFLVKRPEVLAQFVNPRKGFKGYRMYLFPRGCILETEATRNAAYVIRFDGRIPHSRRALRSIPDSEVDQMISAFPEARFITAPKSDKRAEAARGQDARVRRYVHTGDWRRRLAEAIEEIS